MTKADEVMEALGDRYFRHTAGFGDGTRYVAVTIDSFTVYARDRITGALHWSRGPDSQGLDFALKAVARGDWREISREEAEAL